MPNEKEKNAEVDLKACLYDKSYDCPVCEYKFKSKMVRKGKAKFLYNEFDLKPVYEPIQPDYYDVVVCERCGYAAISSKFDLITYSQQEQVAKQISPKFEFKGYPDVYDADTAIERYRLALLNCVVKKSRAGEKAYICLKLAWIYRDKDDKKNEFNFLKSAYDGFLEAYATEKLPICGLDEETLLYIIAAIGTRIGHINDSKKLLGRLMVRKNLSKRLKDKIVDLREELKMHDEEETE